MDQRSLSERLAGIARTLRSEAGSENTLDRIVVTAAGWIGDGDTHAAISLATRGGNVETAAANDGLPRRGDELQYELHEGPCLDAAWRQEQVYSGGLETDDRWPVWAPKVASELGGRSMLCTQLFTNENTLGALNLYSKQPHAFDQQARSETLAFAAHAAVAFASAREIDGLSIAVDHRTTIGQALGIVMERFDITDDRAFDLLRRVSSQENRRLYDVATDVVRTRRLPPSVERP